MLPHGSPHPTELSIRGFGPRFLSPRRSSWMDLSSWNYGTQLRLCKGHPPWCVYQASPHVATAQRARPGKPPKICGVISQFINASNLCIFCFVEGCPTRSCIMGQMPLAHRRNRDVPVPCFPHPKAVRLQRSGCFNYVTHKHLNFNHKMFDSRCKVGILPPKWGWKQSHPLPQHSAFEKHLERWVLVQCNASVLHGGVRFVMVPQIIQSLDHFHIETMGDLGILHFKRPPYGP